MFIGALGLSQTQAQWKVKRTNEKGERKYNLKEKKKERKDPDSTNYRNMS